MPPPGSRDSAPAFAHDVWQPNVAGPHVDGKNVAGSYSALMVCEVGDPVAGGYYMLPQYRAALDVRQGAQLPSS